MRPCGCLSAEEAASLVRGKGTEQEQGHARKCEVCARRVAFIRRVDAAGVGPIADSAREIDGLVLRLLAAGRSTWWRLAKEPEYRRPDVVRRLLRLGVDARLRDRQLAVDLAKAATTITDSLSGDVREAADLRFEAWKFFAAMLREAGRYAETQAVFVHLEKLAQETPDPELSHASVLLSRALFFAEPDVWRPDEAATLLDRAEMVFSSRRDDTRIQAALTARALLLCRSGDLRGARAAFASLLESTSQANRESYLNALGNLTFIRVELHEADADVAEALALLIEENETLGRTLQVARARWMMGRVHVVRGEYDAAVKLLKAAMADIGDSDAWVRVGMDTLAALLLAERQDEVCVLLKELASTAVALDEREPNRRRCAYSRTASASSRAERRDSQR